MAFSEYMNFTIQITLRAIFLKMDQCQPQSNCETQPFWVQIMPNGHILAGFTIGTLRLATIATLHLRARHKTKTCSQKRIFISWKPRFKKKIITTWYSWQLCFLNYFQLSILKIMTSYFTHYFV